jgi:hypothetical protein
VSDLDLAVDSNALPTASILPDSSSSNAPSDVSKQLPQSTVDAWNATFNAAKLAKTAQDTGWQPVSPNPWPTQAASASNAQHGGLNFSLAPSKAVPTAPAAGATAKAAHSSAGSTGAPPSPIDPASLPPGPLNQADYQRVTERNRYLASKYDPNNLYDRFINSFTGAMNDPANVRTHGEQAEHEALSQKIIDTVFPQPTLAEARLNMMAASPIGTVASLVAGAAGGSQQAQDLALIGGSTVDTFGLGRGLQTGELTSVTTGAIRSSGRPPTKPTAQAPQAPPVVSAAQAGPTPANWGTGPLRAPPSSRPLEENEDILIDASHGLQSRLPGAAPFQNVTTGMRPDEATKYLWTVDERGVNLALEKTPFPTPRGNIVHTNLSAKASIGGEAWFGADNSVTINAGSGRFGDRAGITRQQWEAAVKLWEAVGYKVNEVPFGAR